MTLRNDKPVANVGSFTNKSERDMYENLYLDANIGSKETNPMVGHANGDDIHPYSFRTLFLIAYWNIIGNFTLAGPLNGAIAGDAFRLENQVKGAEGGLGPGTYWDIDGLGVSTFGMNFVYYLASHAGIETHPYSIRGLYLISYWNIIGRFNVSSTYARDDSANYSIAGGQGAFYVDQIYSDDFISNYGGACLGGYDTFNANSNNIVGASRNPMADHANGDDIHPYSFRTLFLIAYWNINGAIYPDRMAAWWDDMGACRSGCIEIAKTSNSNVGPLYDGTTTLAGIRINASWQVPTGQENKPYSIRALYLIAYWNIMGDATFRALFAATENAATDLIIGAYKPNGALQCEAKEWEGSHLALDSSYMNPCAIDTLKINANKGTKETNPMYSHASGGDIHPYSIMALYLIAY